MVQFEEDVSINPADDMFGVDQFLDGAKRGAKRGLVTYFCVSPIATECVTRMLITPSWLAGWIQGRADETLYLEVR